jgi:hypothetical protein
LVIAVLDVLPLPLRDWVTMVTLSYMVFFLAFAYRLPEPVGDYSYGLYLFAFPAQQIVAHLLPSLDPVRAMGLTLLAIIVPAVVSWHFIEKPALGLKQTAPDTATALMIGAFFAFAIYVAKYHAGWSIFALLSMTTVLAVVGAGIAQEVLPCRAPYPAE